ncbi:MAG: SDR family NAD(P)-dependent oxidoreductase, partial [Myxococcales bacterium]|nr:SDR family NAD(P)-dependent oxidoreductase [Myxococcales bacterium]
MTGASSGVGFGASIGLARSGFHVVMLCRDQARGEAAREAIGRAVPNASSELVLADLADFDAVRRAAETISRAHPRIRLLLNNAGVYLPMRRIGPSGVEMNFAVHVVGPHLLTERLLPCLRAAAPARIINLTGELHRRAELVVDDLQLEQGY